MGKSCQAFDIEKASFTTRHSDFCLDDQLCVFRGIDNRKLHELVQGYVIPLVCSTIDQEGFRIEIVDGRKINDFTAISHVWAGGMGNFHQNQLYECQLLSLHNTISKSKRARSKVHYWLDTICIPIDEALKQLAMGNMAQVYASAKDVLVLDPHIQHTNAVSLNRLELEMIVASSPWMARSWTLQEAALAVELNFQFHDMKIPYGLLDSQHGPMATSQLQLLWNRDVDRTGEDLIPEVLSSEDRLVRVWHELSRRSSKGPEDVAAIIAIFLHRSAHEVLALPHFQRTHAILKSQGFIPTGLLFTPAEDMIGRWTPRLPNCKEMADEFRSRGCINFTQEGLLELETSSSPDLVFYLVGNKVEFEALKPEILPGSMSTGCRFHIQIMAQPVDANLTWHGVRNHRVLLLLPHWALQQATEEPRENGSTQHIPGMCFYVRRGKSKTKHARYYRCFRWTLRLILSILSIQNPILLTAHFLGLLQ